MTHHNCDKLVTNALENAIWYVERYGDSRKDAHYVEQFRAALASHQSAPSKPTDEKRAALDAIKKAEQDSITQGSYGFCDSEIADEVFGHFATIKAALITPPDNVGDEVVEALKNTCYHIDMLRYAQEQKFSKQELDALLSNVYQAEVDASKALIKKNGGGWMPIEIVENMSRMEGVEECTYGDTDYDSASVAFGYNLALDNAVDILKHKQPKSGGMGGE